MADTMTELQMQAKCVFWMWNEFPEERRMLHCNMNNEHNRIAGATSKALGVVDGVSDLEWITYGGVIFIELKLPGRTQSPAQIDFMNKVRERGSTYVILYSFEEFKTFICNIIGR